MEKDEKIKQAEKILGWLELKQTGKKVFENNFCQIIEKENREIYCPKKESRFNEEEGALLKEIVERFQTGEYKEIKDFVKEYCEKEGIVLKEEQKKRIERILKNQLYGYGIISSYLEDENLEEISVIGKNKPIYIYHKEKGWLETNAYFSNEKTIEEFANRMSRNLGRRLSLQNPSLNAVLENGDRINANIKPIAFTGNNLTIRKFKKKPFTPLELVRNKTLSPEFLAFASLVLEIDASVLIAGNTGSGKTTLLNVLLSLIPPKERIIVVEETPEIKIIHKHSIKMCSNEERNVKMKDLIVQTLRMRPDRIIVGEVRKKDEIEAFVDTLLAGHGKGSYATFHAQTAKDALKRMENQGILKQDLEALDLIIVQRRWSDLEKGKEIRRITEVSDGKNILFQYSFSKDKLIAKAESKKIKEKIKQGYRIGNKEYRKKIRKRCEFFKKYKEEGLDEFFHRYNKEKN